MVQSIAKKEIPIPTDNDAWDKLFDMRSNDLVYAYKNVRDELINYNHPPVTLDELCFFERGLFKCGKLDEYQSVSDDTLRRILIPLASNEPSYLFILKTNADAIKKIIEKANDSVIEFQAALESKSPEIINNEAFRETYSILVEKCKVLSPAPNVEIEKSMDEAPVKE